MTAAETPVQQFRRVVPREHRRAVAALIRRGWPLVEAIVAATMVTITVADYRTAAERERSL